MLTARKLFFTSVMPAPSPASFIVRDPATGYLMRDGVRYRWGGSGYAPGGLSEDTLDTTTYPALTPTFTSGALHLPNHAETDVQVAALVAMNARVTRSFALLSIGSTLAVMPTLGSYNSDTFETVDYALTRLAANNIKAIFPLVDNYDYFTHGTATWCTLSGVTPDANASQFYSDATVKTNFKAFISTVLNHVNAYTGVKYKNDPTILAFETGNELDNGTVSDAALTSWTDEISTHIKVTEGAQQLVADGVYGLTSDWVTFATGRLVLPNVDLYSTHSYDTSRTPANILLEARVTRDAGKAFYLGEYPGNGAGLAVTLDQLHQEMADNPEIDGTNFWSAQGAGISHGGGFMVHPGDANATKFSNHAALIPTLISTELLVDNFTDTDGTAATSHIADSGSVWAVQGGSAAGGKIQNNRLYFDAASYLYSSGRPSSPDYDVTANVRLLSSVGQAGVCGRMLETAQTMYFAFVYNVGGNFVYLYRFLSGSGTSLSNVAVSPTLNTDYPLMLRMRGDQISVWWNGSEVIAPITDPYIKATGKAGAGGTGVTSATGVHLDNIVVTLPSPPGPPIGKAIRPVRVLSPHGMVR